MTKTWTIVIQRSKTDKLKGLLGTVLLHLYKYNIYIDSFRATDELYIYIYVYGSGYELAKIKNDNQIPILKISKHIKLSYDI